MLSKANKAPSIERMEYKNKKKVSQLKKELNQRRILIKLELHPRKENISVL